MLAHWKKRKRIDPDLLINFMVSKISLIHITLSTTYYFQFHTTMKIQFALTKLNAVLALASTVASASDMFQSASLFRDDGADEGSNQNIVGGTVVSRY